MCNNEEGGNILFPADYEPERIKLIEQMRRLQEQMKTAPQEDMPALDLQFNTLLQQYRLYYDDDPLSRSVNPF